MKSLTLSKDPKKIIGSSPYISQIHAETFFSSSYFREHTMLNPLDQSCFNIFKKPLNKVSLNVGGVKRKVVEPNFLDSSITIPEQCKLFGIDITDVEFITRRRVISYVCSFYFIDYLLKFLFCAFL